MAEARAQAALGWKSELAIANGKVSYRLIDKAGNAVAAKRATANFRRPAYAAEDQEVALVRQPDGLLSASAQLRDGIWSVEIQTEIDADRPYRETRRLTLRNGVIQ
jgi:nitrogen fixation protein FixH